MHQTTRAIVLHTVKYSETSIITKLYTEQNGLVSFLIKGARSVKSKNKAAMFQPLRILEISYPHRQNKNLQYIKDCRVAYAYRSLPFDVAKCAVALFILEVIHQSLKEHVPDNDMFEFIMQTLQWLDTAPLNPDFHLLFLIHFSRYLGFVPNDNFSEKYCFFDLKEGVFTTGNENSVTVVTPHESEYIHRLLNCNMHDAIPVHRLLTERRKTLKNLIQYYSFHIENFSLKSPEVLETVMS